MRKNRSEKIQPVVNVAEQAEQKASRRYAESREYYEQALRKYEELQLYQREYSARSQQPGATLDLAHLKDNRAFLARLAEIVRIQAQVVEQQKARMHEARETWIASRHRSKSLDNLSNRYRSEERREADRREQKHSDELNSMRHSWLLRQRLDGLA